MHAPKILLHIGCGHSSPATEIPHLFTGWEELRLAENPYIRPDFIAPFTDMSIVETDSIDGIYTTWPLTELSPALEKKTFGECARVLKPGGILVIKKRTKGKNNSHNKEQTQDSHFETTKKRMTDILKNTGFKNIKIEQEKNKNSLFIQADI